MSIMAALLLSGCSDVVKRVQADIWNIEPKDASIYRVVEKDGKVKEEYIYCSDPSAKKFKAIIDTDLKKWTDLLVQKCTCTE